MKEYYAPYDKELLAILKACLKVEVLHLDRYLTIVFTDYKPLVTL